MIRQVNTATKYALLTIAFLFLSSGTLVAGLLDVYHIVNYNVFWLLLPMTGLFISTVIVNDRLLISRLLMQGKLGRYCAAVFGLVYTLTLLALGLEYATRRICHLPMRIADYSSPWILVDSLGNGLLLGMIILGLGLLHLFNRWKKELATENDLACKLESYLQAVRHRLNPSVILDKLKAISAKEGADSGETENGIRDLSTYLRNQLYELPAPPKIETSIPETARDSRIATLVASGRFRGTRHLVFLAILLTISCGAFFNTPDRPEFTLGRLTGVLSLFAILATIAYVNILWLYPRFMKGGNIKRYAVSVGLMLLLLVAPLIIVQILTYEPNVYSRSLPITIAIISTIGSILTLFLFIGGISAALMLQNWIHTRQRLTLLRAETIRQEYAYLRKQINPHFLFNVLNNISITAYDNPTEARAMIGSLKSLLEYQLGEMGRDNTTLSQEVSFIKSYFTLEATRRDTFDYRIDVDARLSDVIVPTLLFIPFIENAVKYSRHVEGAPDVSVSFQVNDGRLTFLCSNHYAPGEIDNIRHGGIGLSNTRRRLDLIYDKEYSLICDNRDNTFYVKLEIPLR